jgi:signal transduction histidine kinase
VSRLDTVDLTTLGMSITREIMELQGGEIRIVSAPRQGTTVTLLFPLCPADSTD